MKKLFFLFALLLTFSFAGIGQVLEPVKWSFETEEMGENTYKLVFKASIEKTWHLYSQDVPSPPDGPEKTAFYFYGFNGFEFVDKNLEIIEEESFVRPDATDYIVVIDEPEGIEDRDPNFDNNIIKFFEDEADFTVTVKLDSDEPVAITGYVYFMCCDESRCIPPAEADFEFLFNGAKSTLTGTTEESGKTALIEVETIGEKGETVGVQKESKYKRTAEIIKDKSVLVNDLSNKSLWELFFFSILAGLAAILTPCVFPMIPMTVSFFMKDPDKKSQAKIQAIAFGISIIAIYTIVGTIIAVTLGVNFANWLSTHWLPNVLFFLIFVIFAASFFGMFEITMPSWMINKTDSKADKGGITGSFFMAFTLVLVSFSCTGPLVGLILVEAAGGAWLEPIVGMLGFSVAFALPFTLFAFFPSWMNKLPKSGGWLNSVKVILGFIELALGLKFLSIADQTYHWGILDREIYLALWIIIFVLMGFYLLGKIKFAHDSDVKYIGVPRLLLVIITFTFVIYLIPGMFGAPLKALSGYLPPMASHDFDQNEIARRNALAASGVKQESSICETPKYHEFLHLPHGLEGYYDYEQGLECAKKLNKPIFIDFTGHGCVNCREMEANVWSDPRVLRLLKEEYIVISLYVDDKTFLPEDEWVLSSADNKLKKSIGKVYADVQIHNFNINAQPYYVLLDHDGGLLEQPSAYDLDIEKYVKFLEAGVEMFKNGEHL